MILLSLFWTKLIGVTSSYQALPTFVMGDADFFFNSDPKHKWEVLLHTEIAPYIFKALGDKTSQPNFWILDIYFQEIDIAFSFTEMQRKPVSLSKFLWPHPESCLSAFLKINREALQMQYLSLYLRKGHLLSLRHSLGSKNPETLQAT